MTIEKLLNEYKAKIKNTEILLQNTRANISACRIAGREYDDFTVEAHKLKARIQAYTEVVHDLDDLLD